MDLRTILTGIYFIIALVVVVLTMIQSKEDEGLTSTLTGSSTGNFYEKNKTRTKSGKQKKWTVILSILLGILTIVLGILWMA